MSRTLSKEFSVFHDKCGEIVGAFRRDTFLCSNESDCIENLASPIEDYLYVALETFRTTNSLGDGDVYYASDGTYHINGLQINPQVCIGKFRVDFKISYTKAVCFNKTKSKEVIVECDSQAFHDRTEKERRYEKLRDRFLQSNGYKVFRFTGKEIIEDPFKVAKEILDYVTESENIL